MTGAWFVTINTSSNCADCARVEDHANHVGKLATRARAELAALVPHQSLSVRAPCGCSIGFARMAAPIDDGKRPPQLIERDLPPHAKAVAI